MVKVPCMFSFCINLYLDMLFMSSFHLWLWLCEKQQCKKMTSRSMHGMLKKTSLSYNSYLEETIFEFSQASRNYLHGIEKYVLSFTKKKKICLVRSNLFNYLHISLTWSFNLSTSHQLSA